MLSAVISVTYLNFIPLVMAAAILAFLISSTSITTEGATELIQESIFFRALFTNSMIVLFESSDP